MNSRIVSRRFSASTDQRARGLPRASGTQIACNDDTRGCGDTRDTSNPYHCSRVTPTVTAGQTYFIVVDGYATSQGTFLLTVMPPS